ncbi:hypothetical protein Tco_0531784 [Tanacetum coccineum]
MAVVRLVFEKCGIANLDVGFSGVEGKGFGEEGKGLGDVQVRPSNLYCLLARIVLVVFKLLGEWHKWSLMVIYCIANSVLGGFDSFEDLSTQAPQLI